MTWLLLFIISLAASPLMPGIINRTKAVFAGRHGQPIFQLYYDIFKLMRKGSVYSTSSSLIFRLAPAVTLASTITAALLLPYAGITVPAPFSFHYDIILFVYIFAIGRFFTVLASLDTASAFCGMGASREVQFSALAEPAFIISLTVLALQSGPAWSLSDILTNNEMMNIATRHGAVILLVSLALFIVMLSENCRVPFDDPTTHLELTMIHEAMILDYSGRELALILYGASLKLWLFASLIVLTVLPFTHTLRLNIVIFLTGVLVVAVIIGVVESVMARFRFIKVPQMLLSALGLSLLALILYFLGGK